MTRYIQILLKFINQQFCWHKWTHLHHHGLWNEPYLSQCEKCDLIDYTI